MLAKYYRRGADRSKPSAFGKSWRRSLPKRKNSSKLGYSHRISKSGNIVTTTLFDDKLVSYENGDYYATFNKRPANGSIKVCTEIISANVDANLSLYQDLQKSYFSNPSKDMLKRLNELRLNIKPTEYTIRMNRFRVIESEIDGNKFLTRLIKLK